MSPNKIVFPKPSVGATGNVIMACMNLEEDVLIVNASKEPEIVDLCNFISMMGVTIEGIGTDNIHIKGTNANQLQNIDYEIIPDRIEAGTYLIACAMCGGEITLNKINDNKIYDMLGREVIDIKTGTIYIRNGKKFITLRQ